MEAPPDAYSQRAEDEEKEEALESWSKRLKIVCFLQLVSVGRRRDSEKEKVEQTVCTLRLR